MNKAAYAIAYDSNQVFVLCPNFEKYKKFREHRWPYHHPVHIHGVSADGTFIGPRGAHCHDGTNYTVTKHPWTINLDNRRNEGAAIRVKKGIGFRGLKGHNKILSEYWIYLLSMNPQTAYLILDDKVNEQKHTSDNTTNCRQIV